MLQSLNEVIFAKIDASLKTAITKSSAQAIYFTDRGGNLIAQHASKQFPLEDNLVALIAGAFFASQQAAKILGEDEFDTMTERGKTASLFVRSLIGDHLIIVVFGTDTNPGLVKLFVEEAVKTINPLIDQMLSGAAAPAQQTQFQVDFTRPAFQRM